MLTLTRTEIKWLLNMVKADRDSSEVLMDVPGQRYAALHKLEYENMTTLAEKLEDVLEIGVKRIAVGGGI